MRLAAIVGLLFWVGLFLSSPVKADTLQSYSLVCKHIVALETELVTYEGVLAIPPSCLFIDKEMFVVVVRQPLEGPARIRIGTSPVEYYTYQRNIKNFDYGLVNLR